MNTVYRSVWNAVTRTFVAAAETARRSGKSHSLRRRAAAATISAVILLGGASGEAWAGITNVTAGLLADSSGEGAAAVGYDSKADGKWAVAFGPHAQALNEAAMALGAYSSASAANSIAIGSSASAKAAGSVALGAGSSATEANTVSVGNSTQARRITNVADGVNSRDAATVGQLNTTRTQVTDLGTRVGKVETDVSGVNRAVSANSSNIANLQTQFGNAVVYDTSARMGVTLGGVGTTKPVQLKNVADGVAPTDAANVRQLSTVSDTVKTNTTGIKGLGASVDEVKSSVAGVDTRVTANTQNVTTLQQQMSNTVTYDSAARQSVTLGGKGAATTVQLKNVADGVAETDAANMRQLGAVGDQAKANATSIEGVGTRVGEVASDLSGVSSRVTTNTEKLSMLDSRMDGAVMYDSPARNSATLGGTNAKNAVQLKNVANGRVAADSTDAVNGSQLHSTNVNVANNASAISHLSGNIADGSVGLVQQNGGTRNITVGKNTGGTAVDFSGTSGARLLSGVKDGKVAEGSTTAVNGGQLHGASRSVAEALGGGSTVNADGTVSAPSYSAGGLTHNTVGGAVTNLDGRVSANSSAITGLQGSVGNAVMYDSATKDRVTLGGASASKAVTVSNVADGDVSETSKDAVNGSQLNTTNVKVDRNTTDIASLNSSIASGNIGLTQQDAINRNITVGKSTDGTVVDFSGTAGARQLYGVSNGTVAPGSTYAINGGQFYNASRSVANSLGGGSTVNTDGTVSAPSYSVGGQTYNNVGGALTNLDGRVTTIESSVSNVTGQIQNGQIGLVKQDAATGQITVGADKGGSTVNVTGAEGARTVTGVANGSVASGSTDAVNGGQIYDLSQEIGVLNNGLSVHASTITQSATNASSYTDQQMNKALQGSMVYTDRRIATVKRDASAGTAAAMAMAQLPQSVRYGKGMASVGGATFDGESAVAVGLSAMTNGGRWVFKGSASANTRGDYGFGVGAGMHF